MTQPPPHAAAASKRARSGYFMFCDDVREASAAAPDPEIEGKSMAVASKVLAARWKALAPEARAPYEARARELKAAFDASRPAAPGGRPGGAAQRNALPSGWRSSRDVLSGAVVYTSLVTRRSRWDRPAPNEAVAMPPPPPSARRLYELAVPAGEGRVDFKDLDAEARAAYEAKSRAARAEYNERVKGLAGVIV